MRMALMDEKSIPYGEKNTRGKLECAKLNTKLYAEYETYVGKYA